MEKEYCDKCKVKFNQNKDSFTQPFIFEDNIILCRMCAYHRRSKK